MKKVLKKFGKYLLLDRLAQGGMAEIFRAWAPSVDGGGRLIVLKCVQPSYGQDPEFIQMFRSEIRVTMGLNHPNIVQLYDFGEADNQPFIAMELVDGKNLKQFTTRVQQRNQLLAPEYAAHIISQVAAGLHYAHSFRDRTTGIPLNIIHRDVSPQNLLIAYEGNVKIIDFGIAKASSNRQATRAGIIKGKPSYLSPEQIDGIDLDGRSDIFSLGAVLWETLTGRKLFAGNTDLEAIRMIEDCDKTVKAPSKLNPSVPPELDAIVLKALAKDREKRFKNAEEMQRALHRFVYQFKPDFDPSEFAKYFQGLFQAEIDEEQKAIRQLNVEAKDLFAQVEAAQSAQNKTKTKEGEGTKMGKEIGRAFLRLEPRVRARRSPNDAQIKAPDKSRGIARAPEERFQTPRKSTSDNLGLGRLVLPILVAGAAILFLLPAVRDHKKQSRAARRKTRLGSSARHRSNWRDDAVFRQCPARRSVAGAGSARNDRETHRHEGRFQTAGAGSHGRSGRESDQRSCHARSPQLRLSDFVCDSDRGR